MALLHVPPPHALLVLAVFLAPTAPLASEARPDEPPVDWIQATRANAKASAEWLARTVDSWFGDRAFEQGGSVSDGRLSLRVFHRPDQKTDVDLRFDARFRLPNLEQYAYVFVGRDKASEAIQDTVAVKANQQPLQSGRGEERSFLAGLGFALPNDVDLRLGLSGGIKPYIQARYSRAFGLTPTRSIYARQTLFLTRADKLGATSTLSFEEQVSTNLTLRWVNVGTVTQAKKQLEWSSTLGAYRAFGGQRVLSLELLRTGTVMEGAARGQSDRGWLVKWEQPWYQDWLLGEVAVGQFRPRPEDGAERRRPWAVGVTLKMDL